MQKQKIEICRQKSIELLEKNSSPFGFLASSFSSLAQDRNYLNIFGRDASICAIGALFSDKQKLIFTARRSLETLAKFQATNGQIPFFVNPQKKYADFYYLGCIDATLWWLIAIRFYDQETNGDLSDKLETHINKALAWLQAQEHPKFYLVQQNEASDWADLMPRSGFVAYSNALWYQVKKDYKLDNLEKTKKYFDYIFEAKIKISSNDREENIRLEKIKTFIKDQNNPLYLSFVNYSYAGYEGDVFANLLAIIFGLSSKNKTKKILDYFLKEKYNQPYPIRSVLYPLKKRNELWKKYMERHKNINQANQYHNGGIWPFIGGFWVMSLSLLNKIKAQEELASLAELNSLRDWQFQEWFDGKNIRAGGVSGQSWNAALYLWAYKLVIKK